MANDADSEAGDNPGLTTTNILMGFRFLFPGKIVEPYGKMYTGVSIMSPNEDNNDPDTQVGLNISMAPGIMFKIKKIGIFFETGFSVSLKKSNNRIELAAPLSLGACYVF